MAESWLKADKLTAEQRANVNTIIAVGRDVGASERDILIALMVAAQESEWRNINYGDEAGPDSRGLFQQRTWWGPLAERMDPAGAARLFYLGGRDGSRGLLDIKDRESLSLTRAGQAVQRSAFPDAYAKHENVARSLLGAGDPIDESGAPSVGPARPALDDPDLAAAAPAPGTVTVTPTVDHTVATLAAEQRPGVTAPAPPTTPGMEATVAPGMAATTAPGMAASAAPGVEATAPSGLAEIAAPSSAPQMNTTMTRQSFEQTFPDAGTTKRFTAPMTNSTNGNSLRANVVSAAMGYLGTPYAWGGNDQSGIDCSGLVQQVLGTFGVHLPRLSADQARSGTRTAITDLAPGDLVATDNSVRNNGADHIAVYAGNGYIIEAPRAGLAVRRRKLTERELQTWWGVHLGELD